MPPKFSWRIVCNEVACMFSYPCRGYKLAQMWKHNLQQVTPLWLFATSTQHLGEPGSHKPSHISKVSKGLEWEKPPLGGCLNADRFYSQQSKPKVGGGRSEPVTLWHCAKVWLTAGLLRVSLASPACLEVYKQHSLAEVASALDNLTSSPNQTHHFTLLNLEHTLNLF